MKYRLTLEPRDDGNFYVVQWSQDENGQKHFDIRWPYLEPAPVLVLTMQRKTLVTIGNITCVPVVIGGKVTEINYFEHSEEN